MAISERTIAAVKTTPRPWWNGPAIRCGKNARPVRTWRFADESELSDCWLDSGCAIGFSPSKAQNKDDTGGSLPIWCAAGAGTPCCSRPWVNVIGKVDARPAIIREKNTPMESAVPEFGNVDRIPDAAPRCRARTLPMIEEEFSELKTPTPIPFTTISTAIAQYGDRPAAPTSRQG
jgi:hypothetical protein